MGQFFTGEVDQPQAQSFSSVYSDAIKALVSSMGSVYQADSTYSKLFNALSGKDQSESLKAYNKDYQNLQLDAVENQKKYASELLNYEQAYGGQYLQQQLARLKEADPAYWANYETQGAQVMADLNKGNALSGAQTRAQEQATRAGQAARGNAYGYGSAAKEVYDKFIAGENLAAQRQANASNFLANSPFNSFNIGSINAYQPTTYTGGYSTLSPYAMTNAGGTAASNAQYQANVYGQQNAWAMNEYNQPSGFMGMLSSGINGAATGFLMGGIPGAIIGGASGGVMGAFSR